jgi:hypothetical protein
MKKALVIGAGVTAGLFLAPRVVGMVGIQGSEGFGMDDIAVIAVIVAGVLLADRVL